VTLYPLLPLATCIVTAALAALILARDASRKANRLAALLVGGGSLWSGCQVLWSTQSDPAVVLALVKASALGWVWTGPLVLHLFLEITGEPMPRLRRCLPPLYAVSGLLLLASWFTPWIFTGVVESRWGWTWRLGRASVPFYAHTVGCVVLALRVAGRACRSSASPAERDQARWVSIGIFVPLVLASATDVLLPLAGVQVPSLGAASYAILAATTLWTFHRFGYSLLAAGDFASEILDTLPDGVALLRLDGAVWSANGAVARLLECPGRRLAGLRLAERLSEPIDLASERPEQRCDLATFAGRRVPVAVAAHPLRDRRGAPLGVVLVLRDLAEVVSLRERLLLSGRLAAVGELAAGIAHEINNPLAFVRANLSMLRQHWDSIAIGLEKDDDDAVAALLAEGEELVEESLEGVDRAVAIVRDVRGLAHGGGPRRDPANLHALIEGVLRMAVPQLRERIRVERHWGAIVPVRCAAQQLQQVFLNLLLNAAHAIGESGTIRIATELDGPERVVVHVEDDGGGIAPEHLERIFDPFFTTKAVGEGLGLGLGIAHGIVRSHGGEIRVESQLGRGTRFSVHLPVDADTIAAPAKAPGA
jgi:signal transduction histidine kinase